MTSGIIAPPPTYGGWFKWTVVLVWIGTYLYGLAAGDWVMDRMPGILGYGFPGLDVLNREGAAVPVLVQQGDWHRLVLDPFLHTSLLGILFSIWVWLSLGGMLVALAGGGRAFIVFLVGGAAGALAHAVQHPELIFAGAGVTGSYMATLGALAMWGFTNRGPMAQAVRKRVIGYLIAIVVLTVVFAWVQGADLLAYGSFDAFAMGAGFLVGAICMLAFGVMRVPDLPGIVVRLVVVVLLGLLVHALWIQVPRALAGGGAMEQARDYAAKIVEVEQAAWKVKRAHEKTALDDQLSGTEVQRARLERALADVRGLPWLDEFDGRDELEAYLATFEGWVRLDFKLYSIQLNRMRQAWTAFEPFEGAYLHNAGIRSREKNVWTSEFEK